MDQSFIRVEDVMQTSLHTISGLASVKDAIDEMHVHNVSSLLIERRHDGDEYGFITVSEIAAKVIAVNGPLDRTSVYEIMSKPSLTIDRRMNVKYAIRLLSQLGQRRALVAGDDALAGFVSLRDMVVSYANGRVSS